MISATHLHAMVIHFPIALLLVAYASEIVALLTKRPFFKNVAFYLLVLGALGTVVSYFSGQNAGSGMEEGSMAEAVELHEQAGTISLILVLLTLAAYLFAKWKNSTASWLQILSIVLFTLCIGAIARTGYLGGELVYKHGAGVELGMPELDD